MKGNGAARQSLQPEGGGGKYVRHGDGLFLTGRAQQVNVGEACANAHGQAVLRVDVAFRRLAANNGLDGCLPAPQVRASQCADACQLHNWILAVFVVGDLVSGHHFASRFGGYHAVGLGAGA